jgi:ankyrin repeat protein
MCPSKTQTQPPPVVINKSMMLSAYQQQQQQQHADSSDKEAEIIMVTIAQEKTLELPVVDLNAHPTETLRALSNIKDPVRLHPERHDDDNVDHYTMSVVNAIRSHDIIKLEQLLEDGQCFEACNNQGEYLIHLACRRANLETIQFLVLKAGVNVNVRDDMGRTILHDLCWRPRFETYIMNFLLQVIDPTFLLMQDVRGHTPFDYSRSNDWAQWNTFLQSKSEFIRRRLSL